MKCEKRISSDTSHFTEKSILEVRQLLMPSFQEDVLSYTGTVHTETLQEHWQILAPEWPLAGLPLKTHKPCSGCHHSQ